MCFEQSLSTIQQLTFAKAKETFIKNNVDFEENKFINLGIKLNNAYTNLALLLSDQCKHTIKIAVYNDESCTEFRDSKEFTGSIFQQFDEAISYLKLCNKTASTINGFYRNDKMDYPEEAIREALINAIIHRDYSYSGSIIINVNDNKMEFISLGGLLPGLSIDDVRIGISQLRNHNLADVFHRLRLIEAYGTGIRRIYKLYDECPSQPQIDVTPNAFRITLPNMNAPKDDIISSTNNKQMQEVIKYIKDNGDVTSKQIEELLDIKSTRCYIITKQMCELNLIKAKGRGKNKKFLII